MEPTYPIELTYDAIMALLAFLQVHGLHLITEVDVEDGVTRMVDILRGPPLPTPTPELTLEMVGPPTPTPTPEPPAPPTAEDWQQGLGGLAAPVLLVGAIAATVWRVIRGR